MFGFLKKTAKKKKEEQVERMEREVQQELPQAPKQEPKPEPKQQMQNKLEEAQKRLRAPFYEPMMEKKYNSVIEEMLAPKIGAHHLYKKLAAFGQEAGWIQDQSKYPLMYELLENARDTVMAVDWRFKNRVAGDDSQGSKAFTLALCWCVYVAMLEVYLCHQDWEKLRSRSVFDIIEELCGFDHVDDYVVKVLQIENPDALQQHIVKISDIAKAPFIETDEPAKTNQKFDCLTAMYFYGMTLAMQKMNLL